MMRSRAILQKNGNRWMTASALADEVNERGRYLRRDGVSMRAKPMTSRQIRARISKLRYSDLFEREGNRVRIGQPSI